MKKKLYIGLVWVDYWIYVFFMLLSKIVCLSEAEMFGLSRMFGLPGKRVFGVGSNWIRAPVPELVVEPKEPDTPDEPEKPDELVIADEPDVPDWLIIPNKLAELDPAVRPEFPVIIDPPVKPELIVLVEP